MSAREELLDALHEHIDGDFLVGASRWTPGEDVAINVASVTEVVHWAAEAVGPVLAAARAEALREAAAELRAEWVEQGRHQGLPGCYSSGYERWLRERADRIEVGR